MRLRSLTPLGRQVEAACREQAACFFQGDSNEAHSEEIVLVTPENSLDYPQEDIWREIHGAWQRIQSSPSGAELKSWRAIGQCGLEVSRAHGIFLHAGREKLSYFCLLPTEDLSRSADRVRGLLFILAAWRHLAAGRVLLHSAGVVREDGAYLFVGVSGAGKSTVCQVSTGLGYSIINDDQVVLLPSQEGDWRATDFALAGPRPPLRGIFFLIKDTVDEIVALSAAAIARVLIGGIFDSTSHTVSSAELLQKAFSTAAAIARRVPGYELHFRKSADFWKLIDAELGS